MSDPADPSEHDSSESTTNTGSPGGPAEKPDSRLSTTKSHRGLYAAVAGIVVVVGLVLALALAGLIPGLNLAGSSGKPTTFAVTFDESGLTTGDSWTVEVAGASSQSSTTTSVSFDLPDGIWSFTILAPSGESPTPSTGTVTVANAPQSVAIAFGPSHPSPATDYLVTFSESGLPSGYLWSVNLSGITNHSDTSTITFLDSNGTYEYSVDRVPGYSPSPTTGSVTVKGAPTGVTVAFSPVAAPPMYGVGFTESGLNPGMVWAVTFNGSFQTAVNDPPLGPIAFLAANGTYAFNVSSISGWIASPSSGHITVSGSPPPVTVITFTPAASGPGPFGVTFSQTGLPGGYSWGVYAWPSSGTRSIGDTIGGVVQGGTFELALPAGSYTWSVDANNSNPALYWPSPSTGTLTVSASGTTVPIVFSAVSSGSPATYNVTVHEQGIPASSGCFWYVSISTGGFSGGPAGMDVTFQVPNGTYALSGVSCTPYEDVIDPTITVAGAPVSVTIPFAYSFAVTFNVSGLAVNSTATVSVTNSSGSLGIEVAPGFETLYVPNGTWNYTIGSLSYTFAPSNGSFTVSGAPLNLSITATPEQLYPVQFVETGLPANTNWNVEIIPGLGFGGVPQQLVPGTTNTSLTVDLPNGSYTWAAFASQVSWYEAVPVVAVFAVNGTGVTEMTSFSDDVGQYLFEAVEGSWLANGSSVLPPGAAWSVVVNGMTVTTSSGIEATYLANGTYSFQIIAPTGVSVVPEFGNITIDQSHPFGYVAVFVVFFSGSLFSVSAGTGHPAIGAPPLELAASGRHPDS